MNDPQWLVLIKLTTAGKTPSTGTAAVKAVRAWMAEHGVEPQLDSAIELADWEWDLAVVAHGERATMDALKREDFSNIARVTVLERKATYGLGAAMGKWRIGDGSPG